MSKVICKRSALVSLADSIRNKAQINNNLNIDEMINIFNSINGVYLFNGDISSSDLNESANDILVVSDSSKLTEMANIARIKSGTLGELTLGQIKTIIDNITPRDNVTILLPEQSLTFEYNESLMGAYACVVMSPTPLYNLETGGIYYLKCNGKTYQSQAIPSDPFGFPDGMVIGNYELYAGIGDSGAPIVVLAMENSGYYIYSYVLIDRHIIKVTDSKGIVFINENPSLSFSQFENYYALMLYEYLHMFVIGETYEVIWDNMTYSLQGFDADPYNWYNASYIGNLKYLTNNEADDNGVPFAMVSYLDKVNENEIYIHYAIFASPTTSMVIGIEK